MAEVNVLINGRNYGIACDDGQEQRVLDLSRYVDSRVKEIAKAGAATTEGHLLVLASILLADEVFDLKDGMVAVQRESRTGARLTEQDEGDIVTIIDQLAARIDAIAGGLQKL